jgi:hypothetical protein
VEQLRRFLRLITGADINCSVLSLQGHLDGFAASVTIDLTMPHGVLEITQEPETQSGPAMSPRVFADQYAAILAEQSVQNYALQARPRRHNLPWWFALAIASGALLAVVVLYFLGG